MADDLARQKILDGKKKLEALKAKKKAAAAKAAAAEGGGDIATTTPSPAPIAQPCAVEPGKVETCTAGAAVDKGGGSDGTILAVPRGDDATAKEIASLKDQLFKEKLQVFSSLGASESFKRRTRCTHNHYQPTIT